MSTKKLDVFENYSVPKAIATLAIPTILSMIVNIVYNMADTFFVARTGDPNQVAAVSLTTPVYLLLIAAGNIFGIGGSAFLARSLGEKKLDRVKHISSFCFYSGIAVSLCIAFVFFFGMQQILTFCGTSKNTYAFAKEYLSWVALGAPFVVISVIFSSLVRAEGSAKTSMAGMMIGTVVNIILDPIMIISMNMGVAGAAIATVIGNICSAMFYIIYIVYGNRSLLSLQLSQFKSNSGIFSNVFAIGVPGSLNNVLMSLSNILMNNLLASYGDVHIAAMGIASKANMIVIFLQLGLGMGIQPLIGYNYGAGNYKRMKSVMKYSMLYSTITGTIITVIFFFYSSAIINLFINNTEIIANGIIMLRALMIAMPVIGIVFVFSFAFQGMGKAVSALVLSLSRQGFVCIPLLFIGRSIAGLNGIVYAQPIADIVSILIAVCMFLSINKTFNNHIAGNALNKKEI